VAIAFGNKFEKESGELQFILTLEGYSEEASTKYIYYRTESFFVHFQQLMTLTVKLKNTLSLKKNYNKIRTIIILTWIMYLDYPHYNNDTIGQI
jgi:hypothetical protein